MKTKNINNLPTEKTYSLETGDLGIDYDYCSDFATHCDFMNESTVLAYVKPRLEALIASGHSILSSILNHQNAAIKILSLKLLKDNMDGEYPTMFKLKLLTGNERHPEAVLSNHNQNGALVPADRRGKVLAATVGRRGDGKAIDARTMETEFSARAFVKNQMIANGDYNSKKGFYLFKEIGEEPVSLNFDEAVTVLTKYGSTIAKDTKNWLITEVSSR